MTVKVPKKFLCEKVVLRDKKGNYSIKPALITVTDLLFKDIKVLDTSSWQDELDQAKRSTETQIFLNSLISPAFCNSHTHLAMNFFRGIDFTKYAQKNIIEDLFFTLEKNLTSRDVYIFTIMGVFESSLSAPHLGTWPLSDTSLATMGASFGN